MEDCAVDQKRDVQQNEVLQRLSSSFKN